MFLRDKGAGRLLKTRIVLWDDQHLNFGGSELQRERPFGQGEGRYGALFKITDRADRVGRAGKQTIELQCGKISFET